MNLNILNILLLIIIKTIIKWFKILNINEVFLLLHQEIIL